MTEIHFKAKEFVYNHHLSVPFRPLVMHADKGIGKPTLGDNLIIHGDNLHALKALLPHLADHVDCIFIDPPYNTGHDGWRYSDNVNAPMIKEWMAANKIGEDDGLRHDKWCAMMWPRLRLLYELLSANGSLWMTLDDNEIHRARAMLDEIFGDNCCVGHIAWQKRTSRENRAVLSPSFDHILVYSKSLRDTWRLHRNLLLPNESGCSNPDNDPRGQWASIPFSAQGYRRNQVYKIISPSGAELSPPKGRCWAATEPEFEKLKDAGRVYWPRAGAGRPRIKQYRGEAKGLVPMTLWFADEVGDTESSKKQLLELFSDYTESALQIHAPKPVDLVRRVIEIASKPDSVILDSFAGTGTTAHAVLEANKRDGGHRRFVLVEMEDYADQLTAERVRRVINGYAYRGTHRTELIRARLTWTKIKAADGLARTVKETEDRHGSEYDAIRKTVKGGDLLVIGEKIVTDGAEGLGGMFTYCTLGNPVDLDDLLSGDTLPTWESLGAVLFNMATSQSLDLVTTRESDWYLGEAGGEHFWLIYKADLEWLKSADAAFTLPRARTFVAQDPKRNHRVFAAARYVGRRLLADQNLPIEFVPLPFALYRIDRS